MTFDFPGACTHEDKPKKGLSGGSVFLLMYVGNFQTCVKNYTLIFRLFSVLTAYFLVGVAYNGLYRHKTGVHLIPQAEFWISLPLLAIVRINIFPIRIIRNKIMSSTLGRLPHYTWCLFKIFI